MFSQGDNSPDILVVSAGSNDPDNAALMDNLRAIRTEAGASNVIWILPVAARPRKAVKATADSFHDQTVAFTPGGDNLHPRSYGELAKSVLEAMEVIRLGLANVPG